MCFTGLVGYFYQTINQTNRAKSHQEILFDVQLGLDIFEGFFYLITPDISLNKQQLTTSYAIVLDLNFRLDCNKFSLTRCVTT